MEETSTDMKALARRAVGCQKWRWMRGMVDTEGRTVLIVGEDGQPAVWAWGLVTSDGAGWQWVSEWENATTLPDLSDRATLGCLEGLVAEAWNAPLMYVEPCGGGFEARRFDVRNLLGRVADGFPVEAFVNVSGPIKAAALVLALEAAPC